MTSDWWAEFEAFAWWLVVQALLERYFELLPQYQGVPLDQLTFRRVLFAGFPCYADGPLRPAFPRIVQVLNESILTCFIVWPEIVRVAKLLLARCVCQLSNTY